MSRPTAAPLAVALIAVGLAAVALSGCNRKSLEEREAERIVAAIERIGITPANQREPLLAALETERVESPRVETLRRECAAAYRALHSAQVGLSNTVQSDPFGAAAQLKAATGALEQAKAAHDRCTEALGEVRKAIGVK